MNKIKLLTPIILAVLASCGTKEYVDKTNESALNSSIDFSYEVDTVLIDAGGEFLFLNMDLYFSDYSTNEGFFYNLNPESGRMEVMDLDKNALQEIIQYDLDGPNNVKGMAITGIKKADSGDLFFMNYFSLVQLDSSNTKIASYKLTNEFLNGDELAANDEIDGMGKIDKDGKYFVSFYGDYSRKDGLKGIARISLADSSLRLFPLDFWGDLDKYEVSMDPGGGRAISAPEAKFLVANGEDFIVSTTAKNELWQYSNEVDSIINHQYSSQFTENIKPGKFQQIAKNQTEFDELIQQKVDEVVFGPLVKDEASGRFYRYSRELDKSSNNYTYVLAIFDQELNQLHEEKLREDVAIPGKYLPGGMAFVHMGNLYSFLNINDELAFVRLKPIINHE
ncbi:DUF4221 domain-containing protein [Algoriphagus halophytocola]|uniref:DUF4221 domain-containing protein n=1 Tax=Algoriphagus halophytocola TaxID=2991499 RepID=A0ABY6ME18_9BACT|nr:MULTISPECIES: DUF4221 domain-containing protein [unclassified Algoriphagus]UZD21634.1 DUF4221 domain-containing protein [Algoriphagus sp. TR-M5]WBL42846.1 DUF4221 domain-containing protein [Algoriphagus sp. TR-M9]